VGGGECGFEDNSLGGDGAKERDLERWVRKKELSLGESRWGWVLGGELEEAVGGF
jgi:hypothetical protein